MKAMVDKRIHYVFIAVFMLSALYAINCKQHSTAHYAVPEIDLQQAQELIGAGAQVIDKV